MSTQKGNGMADEMRVTEGTTVAPTATFTTRLKAALEKLEANKTLELKTMQDRQAVTNAVTQSKKKLGINFSTKIVQKRGDDGKMVIEIKNNGPIAAPIAAPAAPAQAPAAD